MRHMSVSPLEYQVECAMCTGSLVARSDSLQEIFQIVKNHLQQHGGMHKDHPSDRMNLGPEPHTNKEIFESQWFRWQVINMQPLNKIRTQVTGDIDAVLAAGKQEKRMIPAQ